MTKLDRFHMDLLVKILEMGIDNQEFLSSLLELYDCKQDQLVVVLKSIIYDYRKELDEK